MRVVTNIKKYAYIILKYFFKEVNALSSYIIEGGRKLAGEIDISGSKNAALPIMAATILNKGVTVIKNIPNIRDVKMMCSILEVLGCTVKKEKNKVIVDATNVNNCEIPENLMHSVHVHD